MAKTEKIYTYHAADGQEIRFPVAVVQGNRPGPHMVITAGLHGTEYPPIAAAVRLYQQLKPEEISGTVTIVTVSNVSAFEGRSMFVTPVDGKNPNRCFPGSETGSYTQCMVYYLFRDFISKGDFHLDLHCGDMIESLAPFAEYSWGISPEVDQKSKELAMYYGLPIVIGERSDLSKPAPGYNYDNSARHQIPSALAEVGMHGQLDQESVDVHLRGLKNVLRHVGILDGEAQENTDCEQFNAVVSVETPVRGIFYYAVQPGDRLVKDQLIGHVEDYFGNVLGEVRSPAEGRILYITDNPVMIEDNFVLDMATNQ